MNGERGIKTGQISVSKANFLKAKTWSSRCCTLYEKTDRSPAKLQITDESNPGTDLKTLILENVCVIQKKLSKSKRYKVEIHWRKEKFSFAVDSEQEANSWIDHLNDAAEFNKISKKISAENLSTSSSVSENDAEMFVTNLDYQSFDMWTYDVEMHNTEASLRCQLSGPYRLQLTQQGFFLLTVKERRVLYQWPYHFIRRYGKNQTTFTIQAGRKCESGEGSFCFGTKPGDSLEIFQKVNQLTIQLKASQNEQAAISNPRGITKMNRPPELKKTTPSSPTETTIHSPLAENNLRAKKLLPFQQELEHKLSTHSDKYANVNISALPSPEIQPVKFPPVVKPQHFYSDLESDSVSNLSKNNTNVDSQNYSLLEVNNNRSRNVPVQQCNESDYDRLDFNIIENPFQERQKNFKPYVYDSVTIKNDEENLYEEATVFADDRNACRGKLPPVPVVITHKPFMEPATVDDGYS